VCIFIFQFDQELLKARKRSRAKQKLRELDLASSQALDDQVKILYFKYFI
jgi:hypothetical protein